VPGLVERGVGLRDVVLLFLVRGEIDDFVGDDGTDRKACAFWRFSRRPGPASGSPFRTTTSPPLPTRSVPAS